MSEKDQSDHFAPSKVDDLAIPADEQIKAELLRDLEIRFGLHPEDPVYRKIEELSQKAYRKGHAKGQKDFVISTILTFMIGVTIGIYLEAGWVIHQKDKQELQQKP